MVAHRPVAYFYFLQDCLKKKMKEEGEGGTEAIGHLQNKLFTSEIFIL